MPGGLPGVTIASCQVWQEERQCGEQAIEEQQHTTAERLANRRVCGHRSGASASAGAVSVKLRCTNWIETPASSHASAMAARRSASAAGIVTSTASAPVFPIASASELRPGDPDAVDPAASRARVVVENATTRSWVFRAARAGLRRCGLRRRSTPGAGGSGPRSGDEPDR